MTSLRLKRGTTTQNTSYTGPSGELTMDTTSNQLRLHDGVTAGGVAVGSLTVTSIKTSNYTANTNELVRINSSAGGFTVSLPASPGDGSRIQFIDVGGQCGTNPVLVSANGKTILGDSTGISLDANSAGLSLVFNNLTNNWSNIDMFSSSFGIITASPVGEQVYTTVGTHSWTAPASVTSVCVVCVGASGQYLYDGTYYYQCGGGGLGWKNNIAVIPGNNYIVVVGAPGGNMGENGADSFFISANTVRGGGGQGGKISGYSLGGTFTGDGGGNGGYSYGAVCGGGGAGGYSGNGGNGTDWGGGSAGNGGGGAGGSGSFYGGGSYGGGGGGVGLYGQGASGQAPGQSGVNAQGGSGGTSGSGGSGGNWGGGGVNGGPTGNYGRGAVRIIWGPGRSFPFNAA